ncbi:DUF4129 domain-containing protein [Actinocatenispora comari]|uniref:Protein-glutamine gamma-glutamyltransferase-like C-terminal domain-containing protein n=1 Tax=Actinocatenispora comari TaxID=2807577 RepID=A0A8J4EK05_9ACTN|nr:DUF4129 domain-containing protein [Actinocatenispora comari]GIL26886.1 hypothetical protein NUM_21400 [Actinocatenispora comari]
MAALLAVAAVGLAAGRDARADAHNPVGIEPGSLQFQVLTAGFLVLAGSAPLAVSRLLRHRRRARTGDAQRLPIPPALLIAMGLGLLLMAGVALYTLLYGGDKEHLPPAAGTGKLKPYQSASAPSLWLVLAGALLVVAIAVAVAVLLRPRADRRPVRGVDAPPEPDALRAAARAGRVALAATDDPRGAVLACYRAMEQSLATGAGAPAAADTPAEVLRRAADAGLLRADGPGAELVALFGEARYSAHPLDQRVTVAAARALDAVLAELDRHRDDLPARPDGTDLAGSRVGGPLPREADAPERPAPGDAGEPR